MPLSTMTLNILTSRTMQISTTTFSNIIIWQYGIQHNNTWSIITQYNDTQYTVELQHLTDHFTVILTASTLGDEIRNAIMPNAIMPNAIMPNAIMLSVVMPNVKAPMFGH